MSFSILYLHNFYVCMYNVLVIGISQHIKFHRSICFVFFISLLFNVFVMFWQKLRVHFLEWSIPFNLKKLRVLLESNKKFSTSVLDTFFFPFFIFFFFFSFSVHLWLSHILFLICTKVKAYISNTHIILFLPSVIYSFRCNVDCALSAADTPRIFSSNAARPNQTQGWWHPRHFGGTPQCRLVTIRRSSTTDTLAYENVTSLVLYQCLRWPHCGTRLHPFGSAVLVLDGE